mmetsp:Transcript_47189/g.146197  ORF Transcript_47189/g.146197 Transcript_47189/m.146197 type:complete len:339 (-) Transcript_47189:154-1170(-)
MSVWEASSASNAWRTISRTTSQARHQRLGGLEHLQRLVDHLPHHLAGRLDLLDAPRCLAQDGVPEEVHLCFLLLEVLLERDDALGGEFLDLRRLFLLPLRCVVTLLHADGPAREDDRLHAVHAVGGHHVLPVHRARGCLGRGDEARAHPDAAGPQGQGGREAAAVEEAAGRHDRHLHAEVVLLALHEVHALRHERHGGDHAGVAAGLRALGADDVHALRQGLRHVVRRPHHVHHGDAGAVELVDGPLRGHSHGAHEERCLLLDDDVDELRESAAGVVLVSLARAAPDLRQQQVDPERHARLQFLLAEGDLLRHGRGGEVHAAKGADAARVGHGGHELV